MNEVAVCTLVPTNDSQKKRSNSFVCLLFFLKKDLITNLTIGVILYIHIYKKLYFLISIYEMKLFKKFCILLGVVLFSLFV